MSSDDWYRRTTWTEADQRDFRERLGRAREHKRPQYLRIQAGHLADGGNAKVALALLDECAASYPHDILAAMVHLQRAGILLTLRDEHSAIEAYRRSLEAQRQQPNVKTDAWLQFAWFIVTHERQKLYEEASRILAEFEPDNRPLLFPIQKYWYHGANAILADHAGDRSAAKESALQAVAAAGLQESGLRYHRLLGLVQSPDQRIQSRLIRLATQ